ACLTLGTAMLASADKSAEGEKYLTRVQKEFGDVVYGRMWGGKPATLGQMAGYALFEANCLVIGKPAPETAAQDLDGKAVKLTDLKGKVVILDYWATWCGPCKAMIPHNKELTAKMKGRPFVLVSVSGDEKVETVKTFLEKTEMPWTHWFTGVEDDSL